MNVCMCTERKSGGQYKYNYGSSMRELAENHKELLSSFVKIVILALPKCIIANIANCASSSSWSQSSIFNQKSSLTPRYSYILLSNAWFKINGFYESWLTVLEIEREIGEMSFFNFRTTIINIKGTCLNYLKNCILYKTIQGESTNM